MWKCFLNFTFFPCDICDLCYTKLFQKRFVFFHNCVSTPTVCGTVESSLKKKKNKIQHVANFKLFLLDSFSVLKLLLNFPLFDNDDRSIIGIKIFVCLIFFSYPATDTLANHEISKCLTVPIDPLPQ